MRQLMNFWHPSRTEKLIFSVALLVIAIYGFIFYSPSFDYWRFKIGQDNIALGKDVSIQLKSGWYPVQIKHDSARTHVVVVKINPWFPNEKYSSTLDFIYKPDFCQPNFASNPLRNVHKFEWGLATFYENKKVAFVFDGKLRIYFDDLADLNEIVRLSISRQQPSSERCPFQTGA